MKSFILASSLMLPLTFAAPAFAQSIFVPGTDAAIMGPSGVNDDIVVYGYGNGYGYGGPRQYSSTHWGGAGYTGWGAFGWVDPQEVPSSAFNNNPGF
jgi:hypothetical protein